MFKTKLEEVDILISQTKMDYTKRRHIVGN